MSTTLHDTTHRPLGGSFGASLAARVLSALRMGGALVGHFAQVYRARRSLAALATQEDYMLRDIGVTRGDLRASLSAPMTQDPSLKLAKLARERQVAERSHRRTLARNRRMTG